MRPEDYEKLDDKEKMGAEKPESSGQKTSPKDLPGGVSNDALASRKSSGEDDSPQRVTRKTQDNSSAGGVRAVLRLRRTYIIGAAIIGFSTALLAVFFAFLAPFKLSFMKENVDAKRMARLMYFMDQRSDRFLVTLMKAEVAGEKDGKNRYFEAKGWYNAPNPFTQWYKDIRTDKFFEDLEKKQGIRFIRESDGIGKDRLVTLRVRGEDIDFKNISLDDTTQFERLVEDRFESNKAGRRAFNAAIKENTKSWQVIKRYNLRKWGYERLGITKWRFFENTRDKTDDAVKKRWSKAVAKPLLSGRFNRCVFEAKDCPETSNPNDDRNSFANESIDPDLESDLDQSSEESRAGTSEPDGGGRKPAGKISRIFASKIVQRAIPIANAASYVDTAKQIDYLLGADTMGLVKLIAVMRAAEYASSYFTFGTVTDHLKEGEKVSSEEVNSFMKMTDGIEKSDAYKEIAGVDESPGIIGKAYAQNDSQDDYDQVTDAMKVYSDNSRAANISEVYQKSLGKVASKFFDWYNGSIVDRIISAVMGAINSIVGEASNAGIWLFGKITGVDLNQMFQSFVTKIVEYLGGSPVCSGEESGGRMMNCVDAGGAVVAESLTQTMGGGPLTDSQVSKLNQDASIARYEKDIDKTTVEKLTSLENPNSLFSRLVMATPSNYQGLLGQSTKAISTISPRGITNFLASMPNIISRITTGPAFAQQQDDNLYGVKRYGFSEDDLNSEPYNSQSKSECDQEIEVFNNAVGKGQDPPSSLCLMDEAVANSMSCMYSDDEECASVGFVDSGAEEDSSTGGRISGDLQELAKRMLANSKITYWTNNGVNTRDVVVAMSEGKKAYTTSMDPFAVQNREVDLNPNVLRFILDVARDHPIMVNALTDKDHSSTSNHYRGIAVDLNCQPAISGSVLDNTAEKYNGHDNGERCDAGYSHWHYDFPVK